MFTNVDIIVGLVYENMNVEPMVVQIFDEKSTLLVFLEGEEVKQICNIE